ncbi:MAG: response regulator [Isosphaeraceae bacterium]
MRASVAGQSPACEPSACRERTRRRRVLVVDDNPDIAAGASRFLELLGYEVAVALDGRQALEVAREFRPDVALLDVGLPHIDGYELARRLRSEYGPEVLLIIITAYAGDNPRRREYEAYFDRHFTKPLDLTTIADLLS